MPDPKALRARYVFPVAGPPIADGAVTIAGEWIAAVGSRAIGGDVVDLGNVAILPGLVNAHTHLEFSDLEAPLGYAGIRLPDWIRRLREFRSGGTGDSSAIAGSARRQAVELGLQQSVRLGTTLLGEIARPGWDPRAFEAAPLSTTAFLELIAPTSQRREAALELARQHLRAADPGAAWRPGLSPHAPYTVPMTLLRQLAALAAAEDVPLAMHLAESPEEIELLQTGGGPLRQLLEDFDAWEPGAMPLGVRPLYYLRELAAAGRAIVIHGNYLDDSEIAFLGAHPERMAVVYCPRTHAWFQHAPYPLEKMLAAGVTVALGTDSRASAPDLSVLAEMRTVAQRHPAIPRPRILQMATLDGAKALGLDRSKGTLQHGKSADLAVVALPDRDAADPHELLFDPAAHVVATWHRGHHVGYASA